jgi:choline dehydrogenase-like flavoprotein
MNALEQNSAVGAALVVGGGIGGMQAALVIGAGLAGMVAATELASQGVSVHLVEREKESWAEICGASATCSTARDRRKSCRT